MDITVKNLQNKISISASSIKTIGFKVSRALGLSKHKLAISIVLVGAVRMRRINKEYLKHDYVTDVITFDLDDTAEIIICPLVAFKNSKIHGMLVQREILLYVIHGLLHLVGYDDHTSKDIQRMQAKQELLLNRYL